MDIGEDVISPEILIKDNATSDEDDDEDSIEAVSKRLSEGCGCQMDCFQGIDPDHILKHRLNIAELSKTEHDMYLMGLLMSTMSTNTKTSRKTERKRLRTGYMSRGRSVCLEAFLYMENVTIYHIKCLKKHLSENGVTPRSHGNVGKKPHNAYPLETYKSLENHIKKYLKPYIKDFTKRQILYGITRADLYSDYKDQDFKNELKVMCYSTFRHFLKERFPTIRFSKNSSCSSESGSSPKKKPKTKVIVKQEIH